MKFDVLTLFPEMFTGIIDSSILGRARKTGLIDVALHNLRDWATDKHGTVDDAPYGGGPGMVLKVDVVDRALADLNQADTGHVILLTPQGKPLKQADAQALSQRDRLILIAGHYEGYDERIRQLVDQEVSIGDYILTGGELGAMVIIDAVSRLLPGVLGKDESSSDESFSLAGCLLEYPHYTRPETYTPTSRPEQGPLSVPDVLTSGHHAEITKWRLEQARQKTRRQRPDLLDS